MTRVLTILGVTVAVAAVIAGTVYFGRTIRDPLTASQLGVFASADPRETTFAQPQRIVWEGVIEGTLAGGQGIAVRRTDDGSSFQAYMTGSDVASPSYGAVRITGRFVGISCAYAESVFGGRCTPSVEIDLIERLTGEPL